MVTKHKNIIINGKHDKPILVDVFYKKPKTQQPIVIFCHGYKGFKDWGAWDLTGEAFAKAGFFFVKFNFSHNGGTIEQPIDFPDLEAFGYNNYIKELDDLTSVLDFITAPDFEYKAYVDSDRITLIGHSRGGGITMIKTSEDSRISKLITWASVSDYESRFPKEEAFETWKEEGVFFIENGRTKQQMPHYFEFYTSFIENKERLTIAKATKNINAPHLIIHGTKDPTVTMQEGKDLHSWNPQSELFLVEGADHVFGAKHPWESVDMPKDLLRVVKKSIDFAVF
ncbi:alpha/beta hydrolase family protein [Aquimarina sp. 2201CG14-23]|uniref:alpha/beta hydrolase family protein n=1 Tax=Aquimarina mycalae TaxID=3040073 RepID=UPI002477E18C|nr:prolyl oligopeptidase family serine peptidase [Aquimarina sp. 2201CG14-23]MDH7446233.1 prolyl oligopeptidase family serine peptidase [Aquimarina sp. 2201CG14-23]